MNIEELEIEIGLRPDGDGKKFSFCKDGVGFASLQAVVTIEFDAMGEWYISQIDLEASEFNHGRMRKVRRKLEGQLFNKAKVYLEQDERTRLEDHVYSCCGDIKPLWAA